MLKKVVQLDDDTFVEIEVDSDDTEQISGGMGTKLEARLEKIQPLLEKILRPVNAICREAKRDMSIEKAEIDLGLSFTGEGNLFITKSKIGANIGIKLTIKPID